MTSHPPPDVLEAFGAHERPVLLAGGQGTTWRAGDLVLKPVVNPEEHDWMCDVYSSWPRCRVRVPQPLRAASGGWSAHGWGAHDYLAGETARAVDDPRWFRQAADDYHDVLAAIPAPAFLSRRHDVWSSADRVIAEGRQPPDRVAGFVEECLAAHQSGHEARQLVHGDLSGNILRDGDVPAVIDWPAYFWPRAWALAVVLVDALCWEDAGRELLDAWADVSEGALRRALAWRVVTRGLREPDPDLSRERATLALVERRR